MKRRGAFRRRTSYTDKLYLRGGGRVGMGRCVSRTSAGNGVKQSELEKQLA